MDEQGLIFQIIRKTREKHRTATSSDCRGRMLAIGEGRRDGFRLVARCGEKLVVEGKRAGGVGAVCVAGEREGLAAAACPVDFAPLARAAWLRHPSGSAKSLKGRGATPDLPQACLPDGGKLQSRQGLRRVARQYFTGWADIQETPAPAAHAGFWPVGVIVRHDIIDDQSASQPSTSRLDRRSRGVELLPARQ